MHTCRTDFYHYGIMVCFVLFYFVSCFCFIRINSFGQHGRVIRSQTFHTQAKRPRLWQCKWSGIVLLSPTYAHRHFLSYLPLPSANRGLIPAYDATLVFDIILHGREWLYSSLMGLWAAINRSLVKLSRSSGWGPIAEGHASKPHTSPCYCSIIGHFKLQGRLFD